MSENFYELYLPTFENVYTEMREMLDTGVIAWRGDNQMCLNSTIDYPNDLYYGNGSLKYDWDNKYTDENGKIFVPEYDIPMREEDFVLLNSQFSGTVFEKMYLALESNYKLGRVRLMRSLPKTCLCWHKDYTPRIHYPIKTQEGCLMVIEDQAFHLSQDKWWYTNTVLSHTAFNSSKEERIHLLVVLL